MKRSRKSKRVSWAPGFDLCQVKIFLTEDSPSKISVQAEDHLRRMSMMLQHLSSREATDVPPGFECSRKLNQLKDEATCIPMVEWRCPPKFVMSHEWHVAAGEESQEKDSQMQRQMGLFEAIYPHLSSIPQSPSVTFEVEVEHYNDILTPIIPLIPIEEEEAADNPNDVVEPLNTSLQSSKLFDASEKPNITDAQNHNSKPSIPQTPHLQSLPNSDVDLVAAASTALAAIMKSKEQGSLIDTDLLVQIFNDPKLIKKLIDSHALASAVAPEVGVSKPNLIPLSCSNPPASSLITGANLIPPLCRNPPASSSLTGANDEFHDKHNLMHSTSMPGKTLIFPSSRSPTTLVTPMPSNGHLHLPTTNLKPAISRVSLLSDPQPFPGLKPVAPSVSMPLVQVARDLYPKRTIVEPTFSTISTQVNTSPISSPMSLKPIAVPNHVLPTVSVAPSRSHIAPQPPLAAMKINPLKDVNYIKNLIKEHGRDEREKPNPDMLLNGTHLNHVQNIEMAQNVNMVKLKRKSDEPCVYFKTSRGCRRGSNCPYKHDLTFQWQNDSIMDASNAKRMKRGGEIFGR